MTDKKCNCDSDGCGHCEDDPSKELQQKYVEFQMMEQQMKQVQEQLDRFDKQIIEIATISSQLEELKKIKSGTETLVPVANGIFVKGTIVDSDNLVVNVGAGVSVKKTVDETKALLDSQAKEIENYKIQVAAQFEMMTKRGQELESELSEMVK